MIRYQCPLCGHTRLVHPRGIFSLQCPRCPGKLVRVPRDLGLRPPLPLIGDQAGPSGSNDFSSSSSTVSNNAAGPSGSNDLTIDPGFGGGGNNTTTTTTTPASPKRAREDDLVVSPDSADPVVQHPMKRRSTTGINRDTGGGAIISKLGIGRAERMTRDELYRAFDTYCGSPLHHIVWGAIAIERFQRMREILLAELQLIDAELLNGGPNDAELEHRIGVLLRRNMNVTQWIASFTCLRRAFRQHMVHSAPAQALIANNSIHYDVVLRTGIGRVYVRNSQNKNNAGTTRIFSVVYARGDHNGTHPLIFDPSYGDLRALFAALDARGPGFSQLLARMLLRWCSAPDTRLDRLEAELCDLTLIHKASVLTDITTRIAEAPSLRYCRNRRNNKESKHMLSGFRERDGKLEIVCRVGDVLSLVWALWFVAEGRHCPIVAEYNLRLLELVALGRVGMVDCLQSISHQKNGVKLFAAYTGGMFPSQNFAPYHRPQKHQQRYPLLNEISGVPDSLFDEAGRRQGPDDTRVLSREGIREKLRRFFHSREIDPAELFVLYKISFIEFLSCEVFRVVAPLPDPDPDQRAGLERFSQRLRAFLQYRVWRRRAVLPLPLPPGVTMGSTSQFGVPGGGVACTPMAVLAIAQLMNNGGQVTTGGIDNLLVEGTLLYLRLADNALEQQAMMREMALSSGGDLSGVLLGESPYLAPAEIPEEHLLQHGIWRDQTRTLQPEDVATNVEQALRTQQNIGLTLVAGGYTISITRVGNRVLLFDSHGWGRGLPGAFTQQFSISNLFNLHALVREMLAARLDLPLLLYRRQLRAERDRKSGSSSLPAPSAKDKEKEKKDEKKKGKGKADDDDDDDDDFTDGDVVEKKKEDDEEEDDYDADAGPISLTIFRPL